VNLVSTNGQVKLPKGRRTALKTTSEVSADTVLLAIRSRFNPIRGLTPQLLTQYLDQFELGWVAFAALLWDKIEKRDWRLKNVIAKRKKNAARLEWQILTVDDSDEAKQHQEALQIFYDNISVVNALDQNERGGFPMLLRQMMDAVGKYYAVHEIVWQPGDPFTAEFRFVPLWFFENRTGTLRFMKVPIGGSEGDDLEEGGWMITKGDGLMEACSVGYMFKQLPLKDWIAYSDKFGTPGVLGQTNASKDSAAGQSMAAAVTNFGQNWSAVVYGAEGAIKEPISLVQAKGEGALPFQPLVDYLDREMTALWRGSDLSTMSRGGAERSVGASVQEDESDILLRDDAEMLTETLNMYVDRFVLSQIFGIEHGLAYIKVQAPESKDTAMDLKIDELLLNSGARLGEKERLEYYGRPLFDEKDLPLHEVSRVTERITPQTPTGQESKQVETLPNIDPLERYLGAHRVKFLKAFANDLAPLRTAIEHAIGAQDEPTQRAHLIALRAQLPHVLRQLNERGTAAGPLQEIIANALKIGAQRTARPTQKTS